MFEFTSLVPPDQLDTARIRAALLTFNDNIRILADPGWDTESDLSHLETVITSIDVILLSQPTMAFIGAYAILFKRNPSAMKNISVFTTLPIQSLGKLEVIESYRAKGIVGPVLGYELELNDLDEAFDYIQLLKYNQSTIFNGKQGELKTGITITPINSGHTLGGIIWLFNKNNEKIIYSPIWNHSKDSYLEGAKILQENGNPLPLLANPSVMITSSMIGSNLSYNKRVEKFLNMVDATLQNSGTVVIPLSLGSRFLELVHIIDEHLRSMPYQVYLLAKTGTQSLSQAGSMLEWMSPLVTKNWTTRGKIPFAARTVTMITTNELMSLQGSKIVFCYGAGLESGTPASEVFLKLCNDPTTTVILTEKPELGTLAHQVYSYWVEAAKSRNSGKLEDGIAVPFQTSLQVVQIVEEFLMNKDLTKYNENVKEKRKVENEKKIKLKSKFQKEKEMNDKVKILNEEDSEDDEESEDEDDEEVEENVGEKKEESFDEKEKLRKLTKEKEENLKENLPLDIDVRNAKGTKNRMFPFVTKKAKYDDYGEIINSKDFAKKDLKFNNFQNSNNNQTNKLGEKRKFGQDSLSSKDNLNVNKKDKKISELIEIETLHEPRRQIKENLSIYTKCGLVFVDLSNIVDLRSLSLILPSLKPRKLLILEDLTDPINNQLVLNQLNNINNKRRMTASATTSITKMFDIIPIKNNQEIQIEDSVSMFEILLDDSIRDNLKWQKISGGFSIAQVIGQVFTNEQEEEAPVSKDGLGLKALIDSSSQMINIRHTPLAIGDIRLKELKELYTTESHKAEFKGEGTLVIDDKICIRKITEGDFVIEGNPCGLFYEVREKVRNMLAYV